MPPCKLMLSAIVIASVLNCSVNDVNAQEISLYKDPYIAELRAKGVFFGASEARSYLETGFFGEKIELPREVDDVVNRSNIGSYFTIGALSATIAYALFVPDSTNNFFNDNEMSILRGLTFGTAALAIAQWKMSEVNVAPYFKGLTAKLNSEGYYEKKPSTLESEQ